MYCKEILFARLAQLKLTFLLFLLAIFGLIIMVKISILKLVGAGKEAKKKIFTTVGPKFKKKSVDTDVEIE